MLDNLIIHRSPVASRFSFLSEAPLLQLLWLASSAPVLSLYITIKQWDAQDAASGVDMGVVLYRPGRAGALPIISKL